MPRSSGDPCLRDGFYEPLGADELSRVRAAAVEEVIVAAGSRRPDLNFIRSMARVVRTVDERLALLAERERQTPTVARRLELAAEKAASPRRS